MAHEGPLYSGGVCRTRGDLEYLNERSPQAAREVVGLIARRIGELSEHPRKGHETDRQGIYVLWVAPHPYRVFYRIDGRDVVIVHIRHTARRPWRGRY